MTAPFWAGLALLAFGAVALLRLRLSPEQQIAALVLAAAAGLAVMRLFAFAVPLAVFGLGLWRKAAPPHRPRRDARSEVRSAALAMTLDHATGEIDGEVLTGRHAGARLSALSAAELRALAAGFEADGDEESLALLLAYMERRGIRRDEPAEEAPRAGDRAMTEEEALGVLGLAPGASREEIRAAYNRLIRRVHPDLGGSSALAAMLNAAKDVLDPG
jgi:DnaJ-domain-containing protein 1